MSMPEAAVNEDDHPRRRENQVGLAGQLRIMESETKSMGVQAAADHKFRLRVHSPNPRHIEPTLLRRERIVAKGAAPVHVVLRRDAADTSRLSADGFGDGLGDLPRDGSRQ